MEVEEVGDENAHFAHALYCRQTDGSQTQNIRPFWLQMNQAFAGTALTALYALMVPRVPVFTSYIISSRNFLVASCAASFIASPSSHFPLAL